MKKFIYYSKNDKHKEPIGYVMATNSYSAAIKAASQKHLPDYEFRKLFNIEESKK